LGAISGVYMAFAGTTLVSLTIGYSLIYFFLAGHITAAVGYAAEIFPTRVRGTGANLVAGMEWFGFFCAALLGPYMFDAFGVPITLLIWLTICPLVAVACAAGMRRVRPGTVLEEIAR
jgi:putative MFS transporter